MFKSLEIFKGTKISSLGFGDIPKATQLSKYSFFMISGAFS